MPRGPYKLDDELTKKICESLEEGHPIEIACEAVGISRSTYYDWLQRGEEGEEPYAAFLEAATKARAVAVQRLLRVIFSATFDRRVKNWQAAAWILERTRTQMFGRSIKTEETESDRARKNGAASPADARRVMNDLFGNVTPDEPTDSANGSPATSKKPS